MRLVTHSPRCRGSCMIQKGGSRFFGEKRSRNHSRDITDLHTDKSIDGKASLKKFRRKLKIHTAPNTFNGNVDVDQSNNRFSGDYRVGNRENLQWITEKYKPSNSKTVKTIFRPSEIKTAQLRRESISCESTFKEDSIKGEKPHEKVLCNPNEDGKHYQQPDIQTNHLELLEKTLRENLLARPEIAVYDHMAPTPSHLLKVTLQSDLPFIKSCLDIRQRNKGRYYLPAGHHFVYFHQQIPTGSLLPDGTDDLHSPGHPFERRLWVGGTIEFTKTFSLFPKIQMKCLEKITGVRVTGIHGNEKVFVEITRRIVNPYLDSMKLKEVRTLVFMRRSESKEIIERTNIPIRYLVVRPTRALLFRFSALTFNAHRIHLDSFYCRQVEGLKSMIVHGPLTVVFMLTFLTEKLHKRARIDSFTYRNITPLYIEEDMKICARKGEKINGTSTWHVWIEGPSGGYAVKATAQISWIGDKNGNHREGLGDNFSQTHLN